MRRSRPVRLGRLLSEQIGLPDDALSSALALQQQQRMPLGQTLQQLGLANPDDVLRALATQSGVRYVKSIDLRRVESRPGGLSRDAVRTLGIVPVSADPIRHELLVACKAPIPGFAVRALARLSNWAVEPLLVSDQSLPNLIEAYASGPGCASHVGGLVCGAADGPMAIARWARSRRAARLLYERCDPYVWARLECGGATADVIVDLW